MCFSKGHALFYIGISRDRNLENLCIYQSQRLHILVILWHLLYFSLQSTAAFSWLTFWSTENPVIFCISVFNIWYISLLQSLLYLFISCHCLSISPHPSLSFSYQYLNCLLWWPLRLGQQCRWACCFPACVPIALQWARWPGAANKLCIQTIDATNGAAQWTNSRDEQLKRCWILSAREGAGPTEA